MIDEDERSRPTNTRTTNKHTSQAFYMPAVALLHMYTSKSSSLIVDKELRQAAPNCPYTGTTSGKPKHAHYISLTNQIQPNFSTD